MSSSSLAEDAFTRIWHRADASHGHHVEAIAELRERKRWEQQILQCERCEYSVERAQAQWTPNFPQAGELVEHPLCPRCAREVRRGVLGDLVTRVVMLGLMFGLVTILTLAMSVVAHDVR